MKDLTHTLITDYLTALGVPHTEGYTLKRYKSMPFRTMFGMVKLLQEYGVESEGYKIADKSEILKLSTPFLAHTSRGFLIVTDISSDKVTYLTQGVEEEIAPDKFLNACDGNVVLSYPAPDAKEPEYPLHNRIEFLMRAKKWVLLFSAIALLLWLFISDGYYSNISLILLTLINLGGLYITYLLVQKSMNIKNKAADKVCGVLQAGGCDSILSLKASKFFGLFGWSEVGFAYFSVNLVTTLLLPDMIPVLAICNICCLPFTCWSIWYQKFRAKKWCTLCVCVQLSLWFIFFCNLFGGWIKAGWPISINIIPLGLAYLSVMLGLNAIMPRMTKDNS